MVTFLRVQLIYHCLGFVAQVQTNMGYCPQFDAVLNQMTGRETLTMYARLRGVPEKSIRAVVNSLIDILMLRPHADKLTGHYRYTPRSPPHRLLTVFDHLPTSLLLFCFLNIEIRD